MTQEFLALIGIMRDTDFSLRSGADTWNIGLQRQRLAKSK